MEFSPRISEYFPAVSSEHLIQDYQKGEDPGNSLWPAMCCCGAACLSEGCCIISSTWRVHWFMKMLGKFITLLCPASKWTSSSKKREWDIESVMYPPTKRCSLVLSRLIHTFIAVLCSSLSLASIKVSLSSSHSVGTQGGV